MKNLANLAKQFITQLNKTINVSNASKPDKCYYKEVLDNIRKLKPYFAFDEVSITNCIESLNIKIDKKNILALIYENEIKAIIGKYCQSYKILKIAQKKIECNHQINKFYCKVTNDVFIVNNLETFTEMLSTLDSYLIDVYDHSYRTYNSYVCFVVILTNKGNVYIIDCIKLRQAIIDKGLFTCNFKKVFTNIKNFTKLKADFKNITCYSIADYYCDDNYIIFKDFNITVNTYIDWRIENLHIYLKKFLSTKIINFYKNIKTELIDNPCSYIENDEDFLYLEKDTELYFKTFKEFFVSKYLLDDDKYLLKLIKVRETYARDNNESIYYVMTNDQLSIFAKLKLKNEKEIIKHKIILSSIVKQNLDQFLYSCT